MRDNTEYPLEQKDTEESENDQDLTIQECDEDKVFEESACQELIVCMTEGNNAEVEQKTQQFLTRFKKMSGLDKGQMDMLEYEISSTVKGRKEKDDGFGDQTGGDASERL